MPLKNLVLYDEASLQQIAWRNSNANLEVLQLEANGMCIVSRAATPEVWEQHERDGHMPKFPDCPVCVQEHGSVVKHFSSTTNSLHMLHLDIGYWEDLSLDGKRYFVVAGLRVQHEDKVMLVPFFIPVENKTGLIVSQEVFQLIDYIATCKQLQAFHGSKVLRIPSEQVSLSTRISRSMHGSEEHAWPHHQLINRKATVAQSLGSFVSVSLHVGLVLSLSSACGRGRQRLGPERASW